MNMKKQKTLASDFSLYGKGLHTGLNITITFKPAPENYGYKIVRTDIESKPVIEAVAENVSFTERCTVLSSNGIQVATVEHAIAALYACEIDNCIIEVSGPEFPVLDGSSIQYVKKIEEVGIQEQNVVREYLSFDEIIEVNDPKTGSSILLLPDDSFELKVKIKFDSVILNHQEARLTDLKDFSSSIASARTFVFVKEIKGLLNKNLIRGGDLDNAIVIYDSPISQTGFDRLAQKLGVQHKDASKLGYIMNKPLQYDNEPACHKLLDLIGDIGLVGKFIKGKIIANCPGHNLNNQFARTLRGILLNIHGSLKQDVI